jgi:Brp/Blh family beta-carotene 15,15'-monooxygenase
MILFVNIFDNFFESFTNQLLFFLIPLIWPGIAHGSLDIEIAQRKKIINSIRDKILFVSSYLLIIGLFFSLWVNYNDIVFTLFIILSILHFGISDKLGNDSLANFLEIFIRGTIVISLPLRFHTEKTIEVFSYFQISNSLVNNFITVNEFIVFFVLLIIIMWLVLSYRQNNKNLLQILLEFILLFFCFTYFEPLISFLIYFCFLHSTRHLIIEKDNLSFSYKEIFLKTIPLTFLTTVIITATFINSDHSIFNYIYLILVGISSLTIPHIFLVNFTKN